MKTHNLTQGSPEWHAYRAQHFNASDAPAMMGCSPYKTRAELLRELATGITPEVDSGTQRRFDDGHRFEALARPLAEALIGEEFHPVTGSDGRLSASFDGLTLDNRTAFEHKTLNATLRMVMDPDMVGCELPKVYRVQMEQQLLVSGAERVLFMATTWAGDTLVEERHCWYYPDTALRAAILAGWDQFALDLANYKHQDAAPKALGHAPENLPALRIELRGEVMASNLTAFQEHALAVFNGINRDLQTDQDFADAEQTVKWCSEVEDKLAAAKKAALAQTSSIEELFAAIDNVAAEARRVRLDLDKLVKTRKDDIKAEILTGAKAELAAFVAQLNGALRYPVVTAPFVDFAAAIKGKRNLDSIKDAVAQALVQAKLVATGQSQTVVLNTKIMDDLAPDASLTYDIKAVIHKAPDDFEALMRSRMAQRATELQAKALADELAARTAAAQAVAAVTVVAQPSAPTLVQVHPGDSAGQEPEQATLALGAIGTRLGFSVTQKFLEERGIKPRVKQGNAVLYLESDWIRICGALLRHIELAMREAVAA